MKYTVGSKIEMLREFVGLNQTQLGTLVEKDQSYLSKVERGEIESPSIDLLVKIAEACEMHPSYFLTDHLPHRYYDFSDNLKTTFYLKSLPVDVNVYFTEAIKHLYDFNAALKKRLEDNILDDKKPSILKPFNPAYFKLIDEKKWDTGDDVSSLRVVS